MKSESRAPKKRGVRLAKRTLLVAFFAFPPLFGWIASGELLGLLAFPAGPWSAWIHSHSCGFENANPALSWVLLAIGVLAVSLAVRWRGRGWALLPVLLWWPAWCVSAGVGLINMAA